MTTAGRSSERVSRPPSISRVDDELVGLDGDLAGEGALGPAEEGCEHLAGGVHVVVDGLLAHDDEAGLFLVDEGLEHLGDGEGLQLDVGLDEDAAVGAHGEGGADGLGTGGEAHADGDDLGCDAFFP